MLALNSPKRITFLGVLLAIIITIASYNIVTLEHNVLDEYRSEPIDWHPDSSIKLSEQMSTYTNQLLGIKVSVNEVIDGDAYEVDSKTGEIKPASVFAYRGIPYFAHDTSRFDVYYYSDQYELKHRVDPTQGIYQARIRSENDFLGEIDPSTLHPLQLAFANDIAELTTLADIDGSDITQMKLQLENSSDYWEINLIYKDGTQLRFNLLDNLMILRIVQLDEYISRDDGIVTGHYWQDEVYPTYVSLIEGDTILPSFTLAVNNFINGVVGSHS